MKRCDRLVNEGRRAFFARSAAVAAGAAAATATVVAVAARAAPSLALVTYPSTKLANIQDLKINEPKDIEYPDHDSPGVLLKLGNRVEGGIGPDGDIVAFSVLCPHKGSTLIFSAADKTLNCPGHYSRFDPEKGGLQIFGHATQNLPQFRLVIDQHGDIFAVAVDELIYGRLSNVLSDRRRAVAYKRNIDRLPIPPKDATGPQRRLPLLYRRLRLPRPVLAGRPPGRYAAGAECLRRRPGQATRSNDGVLVQPVYVQHRQAEWPGRASCRHA